MVRKPKQKPLPVSLKPIPAVGETFSRVLIDCVGPLLKTKVRKSVLTDHYVYKYSFSRSCTAKKH